MKTTPANLRRSLVLPALLLTLGTAAAPAQVAVPLTPTVPATPVTPAAPAAPVPAENPPPADQAPVAPAATVPAEPAPAPPAEDFAKALAKMRFDRSPEALLDAVKTQQDGTELSQAEQFRIAVLLGDWEAVGKQLASLPPADAKRAYGVLLTSLAAGSQSAGQFYQQAPPSRSQPQVQPSGEGPSPRAAESADKRSLLLSDDFYAVLAAAPADLDASHLQQVTALVKIAVGATGRKDFLARLEKGLRGIGGTTPEGRKLAAQLLSAVDWITDAGPYLPLKREEWEQADTLSLVLAMEYFTQTGIAERDERQIKNAAEMCAFMMQTSRFEGDDRGIFRQATNRFIKLLPALDAGEAEQLIRENFLTQPAILADLILTLGEAGQQARKSTDLNLRAQGLATQNALLRVLAGRKSAPPDAVSVLVMNWLSEAEATYRAGQVPTVDPDQLNDPFIYQSSAYYNRRNQSAERTVKQDLVLANAPPAALIRRLNQGLAQRVNLTLLKLNLMSPREPETLDTLAAFLKQHPGQERELCQDYLAAWTRKRAVPPEDPNVVRMRNLGYIISRQKEDGQGGIPLTRLRQNQNVTDFKNLLTALRALSPEPIEPTAVVQSFMAIHSGAEVYRAADIEAIFGPAEKMDRLELMQLVSGMRDKLKEQWRDVKTQQDAATNRTEQETKDEVSQGYRTAIELVKRGLREDTADWKQFIVRGQLFFDASEFEFSRQIKLTEYVSLRDEAFASYRKAAGIYAAKVPELARGQWTLEPYQMWFIVMLGASDLSQLTRSAARSDPGLQQIGDAMRALPGAAAEGHLQKFGEMLAGLLSQVPGNLRQHFLSAGLQVLGAEHPSAKAALASLKNYQELLDEVQLRVAVDGPPAVGNQQPFGLFVSLEHTRQLAREGGGFTKYLQNGDPQQQQRLAMMGQSGPTASHRDDFAKNIHAALNETFEIASITFHDAAVTALDLPREGWQETPLAYVLLRAKEAAVDRIPSLQLDMDFSDTSGRVVLPVRSQVVSIDAKQETAATRPCPDLALTFTMDEREWAGDGRVVIEVASKAHGTIPPHEQLFDFAQDGFEVAVNDSGLSITEFVTDGKARRVNADRNWQFTYQRKKDLRGDVSLRFPMLKPGIVPSSTEFLHYQDADLVAVPAKQVEAGVPLKGVVGNQTRNLLLGAAAVLLALVAFWILRKRVRKTKVAEERLELPAALTPFSVVAFLRRIQHDSRLKLDAAARQKLQSQIAEIEATNFSNPPVPTSAQALESIARKWLHAAR
jgi:hypothetical protein